nr:uncharacterized mitochondrial protein AtMg00810-like [Tanacetum cinerariifolium]
MTSLKDINDPAEAINVALILFSKAFQLTAPTNNNQRTSSNPLNRQIAQPIMNMSQDRQTQNVGGNGGNQFAQYAGQVAQNKQGYNAWQNGLTALEIGIKPGATTAEDWVKMLEIALLDQEEGMLLIFRLSCSLFKKKKQGFNFKQKNLTSWLLQLDKAPIYDSNGSAEVQLNNNCYDNEIFNMFTQEEQYTDLLEPIPEPQLVPQNDNHVTSVAQVNMVNRNMRATNAKLKYELARYKIQEQQLKIERLLKASVSHDIISIVQNSFVDVPSDLQTELDRTKEKLKLCIIKKEKEYAVLWNNWYTKCEECKFDKILYDKAYNDMQQKVERLQAQLRDLKGKSSDTPSASSTLDLLNQKLESKIIELEFQVVNYERTSVTPHVDKPKLSVVTPWSKKLHASMPSHSVPQPREFNVMKHRNVIASGMFKINPSQTPRVDLVPNKQSSTSIRTHPITNSQRHVIVKENVSSNTVTAFYTRLVHTARTRRPQPKGNTRNARVPSASKSSEVKKNVTVEDHRRTLLLSENQKTMSSECNNIKLAIRNDRSKLSVILGNITITRVYFVEGLGHNLFSVGQICVADLEVAFRRNTCFIRDLDGVDLLKGNRYIHIYTINLYDMASASPICLMARATPTKSWLWHQRLSHLNFDTINDLPRMISSLVYQSLNMPKNICVPLTSKEKAKEPHTHLNLTKDEIPEVIKNFLKKIYVRLQAPVIIVRIENGTEFKNHVLKEYFDSVGITHETSATKTPQQNGVIERRNRTLVEAARTMLIFSHALLFLWAEDKKIMETVNVTFDELLAMAFEQNSSRPGLQSMTSRQISSELELTYAPSTITPQRPSERDLDILFEPLHNEYLGGRPSEAPRTIPVAPQQRNPTPSPTASTADNVPRAVFEGDLFVNPFATPSTESVVSSTQYALYGLKQAPRTWYDELSTFLLQNGFSKGIIDPTLFTRRFDDDILVVQVYVDDIIFGLTDPRYATLFSDMMKSRFEMSMMGEMTFFLGLQVNQSPSGIFINQSNYVNEILKKYGLNTCDIIEHKDDIFDIHSDDGNPSRVNIKQALGREVILNGDSAAPTRVVKGVLQPVTPTTVEQKLARKNELKARGTLLMDLPDKYQMKFNTHKDAKTLMEAIEKRFRENTETKKEAEVKSSSSASTTTQNIAFVSSSNTDSTNEPVSAAASVSAVSPKIHVSSLLNVDSLSNVVIYSFFASQSSSPQLDNDDLKQIDADNLEEMDLKWKMAMLTVRARLFLQRTGRNLRANGPTSMGFDMSKVECYNCHRKGHFARECRSPKDTRRNGVAEPQRRNVSVETSTSNALVSQCDGVGSYDWSIESVEARFLVYQQHEYVFKEDIKLLKLEVQLRDNALVSLRQNLDKAEQEMDDLKLKLEKFQTSSKNLTELLASQTNTKTGLGYNSQVFTRAMFDCDDYLSSGSDESLPPSPIYDSPTKPDQDFSHTLRPSAPIIEDWVSDSEDESETKTPQNVPSFVQPTEQVKSPRHYVRDKIAQPTARNHAQRGTHNQYAQITLPNPQRHVVPATVLTQSKPVHITTVGPVSTAVLKISVTRPRQAKTIVTMSNLPPRRHITHRPSPKACNSLFRVTPVKALMVNAAQSNPQHALKDKGVIDSGCSRHMIRNMSYLSDFEELNGRYVAFVGNLKGGKISGKGKIRTGKLDFDDVYFVKELKFNLFSVSQIVHRENNMYNLNLKNIVSSGDLTCLFAKAIIDESNLWHRRLGHINFKTMNKLVKGKFDGKVDEGFLVGYSVSSKAFRVFNSRTRIVQETLHVNFLENKPNVAGVQEQFHAKKAREESDQQYVLFPVWSSSSTNPQNTNGDATFDKKEPEFEEKKLESEVNVCPSSSAQSKKHDDKTKREAKGKSPVESLTGYKNLSAKFEDFSDRELEDITYFDDENDVGADADFNNLETSIIVNSIPTTRVHRDHLVLKSHIVSRFQQTPITNTIVFLPPFDHSRNLYITKFKMTSLAEKAILSGTDNRPPMLEKDMYDSWKSLMELYMLNRQQGRMILESVENGPLLWPTVEEDGVTRLKKYSELSATEAIQADCDVKATNNILQGLSPEVYV